MSIKMWWSINTKWLLERWNIMWNVKINKPKGKIKNKNWIKSEWKNSNK